MPEINRNSGSAGLPENLPVYEISQKALGATKRHRKLDILVSCEGTTRAIGWLLFGKTDQSLYIHQAGKSPIIKVGNAVLRDGRLVPISEKDVARLCETQRSGTHISLHPSGEVHMKSADGTKITAASIGRWLPVTVPFVFAYWFTGIIETLPLSDCGGPAFEVADAGKSLRLDVVVSPLQRKDQKAYVPYQKNTSFLGWSPHYVVLLNATVISPCEPCVFFLASPV